MTNRISELTNTDGGQNVCVLQLTPHQVVVKMLRLLYVVGFVAANKQRVGTGGDLVQQLIQTVLKTGRDGRSAGLDGGQSIGPADRSIHKVGRRPVTRKHGTNGGHFRIVTKFEDVVANRVLVLFEKSIDRIPHLAGEMANTELESGGSRPRVQIVQSVIVMALFCYTNSNANIIVILR